MNEFVKRTQRALGWVYEYHPQVLNEVLNELKEEIVSNQVKGGSTPSQYRLSIELPTTEDRSLFIPVDVEAMDIIDALDLSGNMKDVLKAIWRMGRKEGTTEVYDYNKMLFYVLREMKRKNLLTQEEFWAKIKSLGLGE